MRQRIEWQGLIHVEERFKGARPFHAVFQVKGHGAIARGHFTPTVCGGRKPCNIAQFLTRAFVERLAHNS